MIDDLSEISIVEVIFQISMDVVTGVQWYHIVLRATFPILISLSHFRY